MGCSLPREKNPFWKGGRTVEPRGYVLIKVGIDHHLADVRGYAYEHRLVAEQKIGRRLRKGEHVHHLDENKQNNDPANLLVGSAKAHRFQHRTRADDYLRRPGARNPVVACACGCGRTFRRFDSTGRRRRYAVPCAMKPGIAAAARRRRKNV